MYGSLIDADASSLVRSALRNFLFPSDSITAIRDRAKVSMIDSRKHQAGSFSGTAVSGKMKTPCTERNDKMCEVCRGVDFLRFFSEFAKDQQICTLEDAKLNETCPFCRLLTRVFEAYLTRKKPGSRPQHCYVASNVVVVPGGFPQIERLDLRLFIRPNWKLGADFEIAGKAYRCPEKIKSEFRMKRRLIPGVCEVDQLREWLESCEASHSHMRVDAKSNSNFQAQLDVLVLEDRLRMIDVKAHRIVSISASDRFVALSYVWGASMKGTSDRNYAAAEGIQDDDQLQISAMAIRPNCGERPITDWASLPRTIKDAADLVDSLGVQYLWVDGLCIDQQDAEDKQRIIANMGNIYQAAVLTIVGAAGQDADAGLPGLNAGTRTGDLPVELSLQPEVISIVDSRHKATLEALLKASKWGSRAWTYQEQMLSRRCMYFLEDEIFFSCGNMTLREGYVYEPRPRSLSLSHRNLPVATEGRTLYKSLSQSEPLHFSDYVEAVQDYTRRDLSYAGDRLAAFKGILTQFVSNQGGMVHKGSLAHGLPIQFFEKALSWRRTALPSRVPCHTDHKLVVPTWSWAGWAGPIEYASGSDDPPSIDFTVLDNNNIAGRLREPAEYIKLPPVEKFHFESDPETRWNKDSITLHLWTVCFQCGVVPSKEKRYQLSITGAVVYSHTVEDLDLVWHDREGNLKLHEFIVLCHTSFAWVTAWLIARHDGYAERVAAAEVSPGIFKKLRDTAEYKLRWEYVRLR